MPVAQLAAPSEIQGKPVDDIINEWTSELERRSRSFVRHAEALAAWDRAILGNRGALLALEEELRRALGGQEALERRLQMLEAHQRGIHEALGGMEAEAERLYREERGLADEEGAARDALYERAQRAGDALSRLGEQLGEAIEDVNEATGEPGRGACVRACRWRLCREGGRPGRVGAAWCRSASGLLTLRVLGVRLQPRAWGTRPPPWASWCAS